VKKARRGNNDDDASAEEKTRVKGSSVNPAVSINSSSVLVPICCVAKISCSISIKSNLTDPTAIGQFQDAAESAAAPSVPYSDRNMELNAFESLLGLQSAAPAAPLAPPIPL